jgi:hypothetical protein
MVSTTIRGKAMKMIIRFYPPPKLKKICGDILNRYVVLNLFPQVPWMCIDVSILVWRWMSQLRQQRDVSGFLHTSAVFSSEKPNSPDTRVTEPFWIPREGSSSGCDYPTLSTESEPPERLHCILLMTPSYSYRTQNVSVVSLALCYLFQRARAQMSARRPKLLVTTARGFILCLRTNAGILPQNRPWSLPSTLFRFVILNYYYYYHYHPHVYVWLYRGYGLVNGFI